MADDLAEEHRRFVRPVRGGARAALWYWWQVLRSAPGLLRIRLPDLAALGGLAKLLAAIEKWALK